MRTEAFGIGAAIGAAVIWGFLGLFVRELEACGFTSPQMACLRYIVVIILVAVFLLIRDREKFVIDRKILAVLIIAGVVGTALNSSSYFGAMQRISISLSTILQYTSPFMVVLMSAVLFRERITAVKAVAVAIAFSGCVLCTGVLTDPGRFDPVGILLGVGSGVFFAVYTLCSKKASSYGYSTLTILFYGAVFCVLALLPFCDIPHAIALTFANSCNFMLVVGLGIGLTLLPFGLYNYALGKMEAGKTIIITYVEPLTATVVGLALYGEAVTIDTVAGILLILVSLILIARPAVPSS